MLVLIICAITSQLILLLGFKLGYSMGYEKAKKDTLAIAKRILKPIQKS